MHHCVGLVAYGSSRSIISIPSAARYHTKESLSSDLTLSIVQSLIFRSLVNADDMDWGQSNSVWNDAEANKLPEKIEEMKMKQELPSDTLPNGIGRKRVVVVGLGMVGIAFIEKLMKLDVKRREYEVVVIGEEPHLAYNRVGLTSFFQHREVENLYLNPKEWVSMNFKESKFSS